MGGIFGSSSPSQPQAAQQPAISALQVQTSTYGMVVPIVIGATRIAPNAIQATNFQAVAHTTTSGGGGGGKGGGGGGGGTTSTTITYQVALALGLCEGPIAGVGNVYVSASGASASVTTAARQGLSVFTGAYGQATWGYMATNYPGQAVPYSGIAYAAGAPYQLGSSASLSNHNFEVLGLLYGTAPNGIDADPSQAVSLLLTNASFGAGFPASRLGSLAAYQSYTLAQGLWISVAYTAQTQASQLLDDLAKATNCAFVWSAGLLTLVPYGDAAVSGNGYAWFPPSAPLYDLGEDDFLPNSSSVGGTGASNQDPVLLQRKRPSDAINNIKLEFLNRANYYNPEVVEAYDLAMITTYGRRPAASGQAHFFADAAAAKLSVHLQLNREGVRNLYGFTLDQRYVLLDPMDIVTLTDAALGLNKQWVRITEITEDDQGNLAFLAEEYLAGTGSAPLYNQQSATRYAVNAAQGGGITNSQIFEPPFQVADYSYEVWIAAAGGANWGGAQAWISYDGNNYSQAGTAGLGCRFGVLAGALAAGGGAWDTVNSVAVDLTASGGALPSLGDTYAQNLGATAWIGGEVIGYGQATLTGASQYTVSRLERGAWGTVNAAHASGAAFVCLDGAPLRIAYDPSRIGQTLYLKLLSFNPYGGGLADIATVSPITYTIQGPPVPAPPASLAGTPSALGIQLSWPRSTAANVHHYQIQTSSTFGTGVLATGLTGTSWNWPVLLAGSYTAYVFAVDDAGHASTPAAGTTAILPPPQPSPGVGFTGPDAVISWPAVAAASLPVDHYIVSGNGLSVNVSATTWKTKANWAGSTNFTVVAVDIGGNQSAAGTVAAGIAASTVSGLASKVIDNNVLLFWTGNPGSLPIDHYEIRKGATWSSAALIGTTSGSFDEVLEQQGATYTYFVCGVDTAGNYGTPNSLSVAVNPPPDYIFRVLWASSFGGTLTSAFLEAGSLVAPVDTSKSWATHFTSQSWASPQDQINAGDPVYIQPVPGSASYREVFDYGASVPATQITVALTYATIAGAVTITPLIEVSPDNATWTSLGNVWQGFSQAFRYVRVTLAFATANNGVIRASGLTVRLDSKLKNDGGNGSAVSTDSGGTTISFNVAFLAVTSITITPNAASASFSAAPLPGGANPTSFQVYLWNSSGARLSGGFSWSAKGY